LFLLSFSKRVLAATKRKNNSEVGLLKGAAAFPRLVEEFVPSLISGK
jgi:hypothetical protein